MNSSPFLLKAFFSVSLTCLLTIFSLSGQGEIILESDPCILPDAEVVCAFYASSVPTNQGVVSYLCNEGGPQAQSQVRSSVDCKWAKWPNGNPDDAVSRSSGGCDYLDITSSTDVLYNLGGYRNGRFRVEFDVKENANRGARYNFQYKYSNINSSSRVFSVLMNDGACLLYSKEFPDGEFFPYDRFNDTPYSCSTTRVVHIIDLDRDLIELFINNTFIHCWKYSDAAGNTDNAPVALGAINFFGSDSYEYQLHRIVSYRQGPAFELPEFENVVCPGNGMAFKNYRHAEYWLYSVCEIKSCNTLCEIAEEIECRVPKTNQKNDSYHNLLEKYFKVNSSSDYTGYISKERIYTFTLEGKKSVRIFLSKFRRGDELDLFLLRDCNSTDVIASSRQNNATTEEINIELDPGTYYIVVDGKSGEPATFELLVDYNCFNCISEEDGSFIVINSEDNKEGSLRWAIECANQTPGPNDILFDLTSDNRIIQVGNSTHEALPEILDIGTRIINPLPDSEVQESDYILLDGSFPDLDPEARGLYFNGSDDSGMEGLIVQNFPRQGVRVNSSSGFRMGAVPQSKQQDSIFQNIITLNGISGESSGLSIQNADDFLIAGNKINRNGTYGIAAQASNQGLITQNYVSENSMGVFLDLSSENIVSCNTISNNNETEVISSDFISRSIEFRTNRKAMENSGVIVFDRSINNLLVDNVIKDHTNHGIVSIEDDVFGNHFSRNLLSCNFGLHSEAAGEAIDIVDALSQTPPLILQASTTGIIGKASAGDTIEVFIDQPNIDTPCEDAPCQGNIYVGKTTADESGNWSLFSADFSAGVELRTGDFITATAFQEGLNTSNYSTCTRIGVLETVCDLGGEFISRGVEYPASIAGEDFAPSALRNVPQIAAHFGGTYPENLLGKIYVFRKVDEQEFEVNLFSDENDPIGLNAFIFECDCSSPAEGGDVLCAQNYIGDKNEIYLDQEYPAGFYYIVVVDTLPRSFDIAIFPNGPCETPSVTLSCGSMESESLDIGGNDYEVGSVLKQDIYSSFYNGGRKLDGQDKEYAISITETQSVSIDIFVNGGISAFLFGVICGEDILVYGETSSQGGSISFSDLTLTPGTYFLVLDQEASGSGPDYTIKVSCDSGGSDVQSFDVDDETDCVPDQDNVHRVNFSGLKNSRIKGQAVGAQDQLILEYKDQDGIPRYAPIKPLYNKDFVNILAYKDGSNPDLKCGFAEGEELKLRILKNFNGSTPIFKGLIGRFSSSNPLYDATKFFQSGSASLIDSVYEDPDFTDKHLNVQPALIRADGNPQSARFDVSSPVPWKAIKKSSSASWYTIQDGTGNGTASFNVMIAANSSENVLSDTILVISDIGLVYKIPISTGLRCTAPTIQFPQNPITLACNVSSVNINPNIQFNNDEGDWRFLWRDAGGQVVSSSKNLNATRTGTYTFQVFNLGDSGCFAEQTVSVETPSNISVTANIINPVCFGEDKGSIQIAISGATGTPEIRWSTGQGGSTITDLPAGIYSATVRDDLGCSKTFDYVISEPSPIIVNASSSEASNASASDGSAMVDPSGGTGQYNVSWSNGATGLQNTGLSRGTYQFTITDASNCEVTGSVEVEAQCAPATISLLKADTVLACDPSTGQLIASVDASFDNPILFWKDEQGNRVSNFQSLNINRAGIFTFVVQDQENTACESSLEVEVKDAPTPQIIIDQSQDDFCADGENGFLAIRVENTTGMPSIKWSNGEETNFISKLSKGSYTVSISDDAGCTASATFAVGGPDPLIANPSSQAASGADESDGSVSVNPSGGTSPYVITWDIGTQGATLNNLAPGTYAYTITDANFCESRGEIAVASCSIDVNIVTQASTCQDAADGTVTFSAPNGSPEFTVTWGDGGQQKERTQLAPGDYSVTLTQANSCTTIASFSINIDDQEAPIIQDGQTIELFLDANGEATLKPDRFMSFITDNCSAQPQLSFSTENFDCSHIGAQTISVAASDESNNSSQADFEIVVRDTTPPSISCPDNLVTNACIVNYEFPSFRDNCTVNLPVLVSGFLPGSTFPEGLTLVEFSVVDEVGNEANCSFTVTSNGTIDPPIQLGTPVISNPSIDNPSGGRIEMSFTGGGSGPFTFEWFDVSGVLIGEGLILENILAGNYLIRITDQSSGCSFTSNPFLVTGIEDLDFVDRLELFPNPAYDRIRLSIDLNQALDIQYSLINKLGQTVLVSTKQRDIRRDEWINVQPYPAGIYFLRIKLGEQYLTRKLIIQKR